MAATLVAHTVSDCVVLLTDPLGETSSTGGLLPREGMRLVVSEVTLGFWFGVLVWGLGFEKVFRGSTRRCTQQVQRAVNGLYGVK